MSEYFTNTENIDEEIKRIKSSIIKEVQKNEQNFKCDEKENIYKIIKKIYENTCRKIVIIIDEWDFVMHDKKYDTKSIEKYLKFLSFLLIKDNIYVALIYMTGILPIENYCLDINISGDIDNYTMAFTNWASKYIGFTDEEVIELCKKYIDNKDISNSNKMQAIHSQDISKNNNKKKDKLLKVSYKNIKDWCNSYQMINERNEKKYIIYSSYSIINAINNKCILNNLE